MKPAALYVFLALVPFTQGVFSAGNSDHPALVLKTRARVPSSPGSTNYQSKERMVQWDPSRTAVIICDMWDQHWCKGASARVAEMAPAMNATIEEARRRGVFIIHAPSETMKFYEGTPARKRAQAAPRGG